MLYRQTTNPSGDPGAAPPVPAARRKLPGLRRVWLLTLATTLALVLTGCGNTSGGTGDGSFTTAPEVALTLYQGQEELGRDTLNLSDLRGQPVVLNFWAGQCAPCRAEMPDLQRFHDEFKDRVTLLGLDEGQSFGLGNREDALQLLNELSISYPAGFASDGTVIPAYQVLGLPTTVFINSEGAIFRKWHGILNQEKLTEITNEMLSQ